MAIHRSLPVLFSLAVVLSATNAAAEFTPIAGWDQQIFPSYIIATAPMKASDEATDDHRLGDARGIVGVEVVAPSDDAEVKVTVECDEWLSPSVFSGTLPKEGETYRIFPKIRYKYAQLAKCGQSTPVSMTFHVSIGDEAEEDDVVACTVRAVNDCPFAVQEGDTVRDVGYTFAAYVNEQHPFVDKLLREALDRKIVDSFSGYQAHDPHVVMKQAYALWDLLVARDIRYSSITVTAATSDKIGCQHVRLIEDSVNNSEANCVDGSVLWASLMQRIGIDSFLVMEPTHCYAGFYADEKHETAYAIETTMLGSDMEAKEVEVPAIIKESIDKELRSGRSFASFTTAVNYATGRLTESLEKKTEDAVEVQIIDINEARKAGILPIAFQNGEEFVWYEGDGDTLTAAEEEASDEHATNADGDDEDTDETAK